MHISHKGILAIVIFCIIITGSYLYYKKQHTTIPVTPLIKTTTVSSDVATTSPLIEISATIESTR